MDILTSWCVLGCPKVSWGIKTDRWRCLFLFGGLSFLKTVFLSDEKYFLDKIK